MAQTMAKTRKLTNEEKQIFLSLKPEDIDMEKYDELFSDRYDVTTGKLIRSRFNTYDTFPLKKGEYFNTEDIVTNCGLFIFNKKLIEPDFKEVIGYVNEVVSKKQLGLIDAKLSAALLEDRITTKQYINYLNNLCELAFGVNAQTCSSLTIKSCKPLDSVTKRKEELFKQHKKDIEEQNIPKIEEIEDELMSIAKKELSDDPSMDLYQSGARGDFGSYKTAYVMKGLVHNGSKDAYELVENSLSEGITKKDIPVMANAIVESQYPKSCGTAVAGYLTKQLSAAFQSVTLGPHGSDCGTKKFSDVTLTKANLKYYLYTYIVEGNKLILLTPEIADKYLDKPIKIRSPLYCTSKNLCNKCAGERFYMLGITNVGLTTGRISNSILKGGMKKFHVGAISTSHLDPDKVFI